jgi:hypothetical protein
MNMRKYEGRCIGGPLDGKKLGSVHSVIEMAIRDDTAAEALDRLTRATPGDCACCAETTTNRYSRGRYQYSRDFGAWLWFGPSNEERIYRKALQAIDDGFGTNHGSQFAKGVAQEALAAAAHNPQGQIETRGSHVSSCKAPGYTRRALDSTK